MQEKKTLKLEVKTLETRIAPGSCVQVHMASRPNFDGGGRTLSGQSLSGMNDPTNDDPPPDPDAGAGVPVIGIN